MMPQVFKRRTASFLSGIMPETMSRIVSGDSVCGDFVCMVQEYKQEYCHEYHLRCGDLDNRPQTGEPRGLTTHANSLDSRRDDSNSSRCHCAHHELLNHRECPVRRPTPRPDRRLPRRGHDTPARGSAKPPERLNVVCPSAAIRNAKRLASERIPTM